MAVGKKLMSKKKPTFPVSEMLDGYLRRYNRNIKSHIFYEVIFNGTTTKFINLMKDQNYNFNTQRKVWILK